MKKKTIWFHGTSLLMAALFMLCVTSCGTLMYPERRGQAAGRIDAGVAVLDGIGLLLFIIPGAVAFAVDFSTGAIYLPSSSRSTRLDLDPFDLQHARVIQTDSTSLTLAEIEEVVERQIGQDINLRSSETKVAMISSDPGVVVWGGISEVLTPDQLAAIENQGGTGRS